MLVKVLTILALIKMAGLCVLGYNWWMARPTRWSKKPFAWRFCPGCRGKLVMGQVDGKHVQKCSVCKYVNWNNPIPVAVVLIPKGDDILLVRRGIPPKQGWLALVSGFVNPFETPEQAAIRETREEVLLDIEIERELAVRVPPGINQNLHFYLAKPITATPEIGEETEEVLMVNKANVPFDQIAFSSHAETIRDWIASIAAAGASPGNSGHDDPPTQ